MYIIKTKEGAELNVLSIYSSVGVDLQELLMDADTAARHEFAIVNNTMMPYVTQTSVCAGGMGGEFGFFKKHDVVKFPSLVQVDVIVFADTKSEWDYLQARENENFFITRKDFHING